MTRSGDASDERGEIDWKNEGERFEREIYGLVRAMMVKAMRRHNRPYIAFGDMVDDAAIFAWRSWHSLRLRGLEPQEIGIWAIADQCVRMVLGGVQFRPVGRGDRCWADSPVQPQEQLRGPRLRPVEHPRLPTTRGRRRSPWRTTSGRGSTRSPERDRGIVMALPGRGE